MIIGWIAKIAAGLYSNRKPGEVAAAVSMAVLLALIPGNNLLWYLLLITVFLVQVNQAVALVFVAILSPVLTVLDPILHRIGYAVLTAAPLQGVLTWLYNLPLAPFTRFNNTLVMGGLVAGLILFVPVFLVARVAVMAVRLHLIPRIAASKPVKAILKVPLVNKLAGATRHWYSLYQTVR